MRRISAQAKHSMHPYKVRLSQCEANVQQREPKYNKYAVCRSSVKPYNVHERIVDDSGKSHLVHIKEVPADGGYVVSTHRKTTFVAYKDFTHKNLNRAIEG